MEDSKKVKLIIVIGVLIQFVCMFIDNITTTSLHYMASELHMNLVEANILNVASLMPVLV